MNPVSRRLAPLALGALLGLASPCRGAEPTRESYGTAALSVLNLNAFAFATFDGTAVTGADGQGGRFVVSGNTCFEAPVALPSGVLIDHTELESCANDPEAGLVSALFACTDGTCAIVSGLLTNQGSGCGRRASSAGRTVVENAGTTYFLQVCTNSEGSANTLRAARVFYRLQVSPAPATATFPNDVPTTHPFFRFVEAVAAARITGGCASGSFCPDVPVTRGQLAVFLSTALGLHFPN